MKICSGLLFILFYSQTMLAATYWSHIPGEGVVQISALTETQHQKLATHLSLNAAETAIWINNLPALLNALSCDSLEVQSQTLPSYAEPYHHLTSYVGVLKWSSVDLGETSWWLPWSLLPFLPQLIDEVRQHRQLFYQPLLLTGSELVAKDRFIVISGMSSRSPGYYALDLSAISQPRLLWSVEPTSPHFVDLRGSLAQPQWLFVNDEPESSSVLLVNAGATEQQSLIYKVRISNGELLATLKAKQQIPPLSGAVALYDQNRDRVTDSLIFSSNTGQLWQVMLEDNYFYDLQLLADLSDLGLTTVQSILPLFAAVPVGGSGSDFHSRRSQWLVLLNAMIQEQSLFLLLKPKVGLTLTSSDLVNRGLSFLTGPDWQKVQQKNGWYSVLPAAATHAPVVIAGVVYLRLLQPDSTESCAADKAFSSLLAMHLHHGSSVYRQHLLSIDNSTGAFSVKAKADGGLSLIDEKFQQVLIEDLREISAECMNCSKLIQQVQFPHWQLMGTYHSEEGAYE